MNQCPQCPKHRVAIKELTEEVADLRRQLVASQLGRGRAEERIDELKELANE